MQANTAATIYEQYNRICLISIYWHPIWAGINPAATFWTELRLQGRVYPAFFYDDIRLTSGSCVGAGFIPARKGFSMFRFNVSNKE
jgi:hypothetical protein